MAQVKFCYGTQQEYDQLEAKDPGTIYYCSDTRHVYRGEEEFSGSVIFGTTTPTVEPNNPNSLYIDTHGNALYYYSSNQWNELSGGSSPTDAVTSNASSSTAGQVPVWDGATGKVINNPSDGYIEFSDGSLKLSGNSGVYVDNLFDTAGTAYAKRGEESVSLKRSITWTSDGSGTKPPIRFVTNIHNGLLIKMSRELTGSFTITHSNIADQSTSPSFPNYSYNTSAFLNPTFYSIIKSNGIHILNGTTIADISTSVQDKRIVSIVPDYSSQDEPSGNTVDFSVYCVDWLDEGFAEVNLGSLTTWLRLSLTGKNVFYAYINTSNNAPADMDYANFSSNVCPGFIAENNGPTAISNNHCCFNKGYISTTTPNIAIRFDDISTAADFKKYIKNTFLVYKISQS